MWGRELFVPGGCCISLLSFSGEQRLATWQNAWGLCHGPTDQTVKLLRIANIFLVTGIVGGDPACDKTSEWQTNKRSESDSQNLVISKRLRNEKPTWCHLLFYFTYYVLNMFRTLIYPPSGACDFVDELPHLSSCSVKTDVLAISVPLRCVGTLIAKTSVFTEQDDRCGNSSTKSQAPEDGYINARNTLSA